MRYEEFVRQPLEHGAGFGVQKSYDSRDFIYERSLS